MVRGSPSKAAPALAFLALLALPGGCAPDVDPSTGGASNADVADFELAVCTPGDCDLLCVDPGRYTVTADLVRDRQTNLVWQRVVSASLGHAAAAAYCANLQLGGLRGFRLPSPDELSGIRYRPGGLFGGGPDAHYCIPCLDQAAFPETPVGLFWTSRIAADDTAWYVGFDDGRMHRDVVDDTLWVRCVHGPLVNGLKLSIP